MATIEEHNKIIKVNFGQGKHFRHVLTNDDIHRMTMLEGRYPISRLPVCPSCEKLGMWGKGGMGVCTECGTIDHNPITLSEYMAKGYDIDPTGMGRDMQKEKQVREVILPQYN